MSDAEKSRVFVSYSHDSPSHCSRVEEFSRKLRSEGIDCALDVHEGVPQKQWPMWMEEQIEQADFVLLVYTETYARRAADTEQPGVGKGVRWEVHLVRSDIYLDPTRSSRYIPITFHSDDLKYVSKFLAGTNIYSLDRPGDFQRVLKHLRRELKTDRTEVSTPFVQEPGSGTEERLRRPGALDLVYTIIPSRGSDQPQNFAVAWQIRHGIFVTDLSAGADARERLNSRREVSLKNSINGQSQNCWRVSLKPRAEKRGGIAVLQADSPRTNVWRFRGIEKSTLHSVRQGDVFLTLATPAMVSEGPDEDRQSGRFVAVHVVLEELYARCDSDWTTLSAVVQSVQPERQPIAGAPLIDDDGFVAGIVNRDVGNGLTAATLFCLADLRE